MSRIELLVGPVISTPYCVCHRRDMESCMLQKREQRRKVCEREMDLVVNSIQKTMIICGISRVPTAAAKNVIMRAFTHYDEIRYRIDRVPRKRLCREDLLHDLGVEAKMDRVDSQLVYTIVKRAFRAYYFGTAMHGKRVEEIINNSYHRQECLWAHAAARTAQILGKYKGLLYSEQKEYEERIQCVYKKLYDDLNAIQMFDDDMMCLCRTRSSNMLSNQSSIDKSIVAGSQNVDADLLYSATQIHYEYHVQQAQRQNMSVMTQKSSVSIKEISIVMKFEKSEASLERSSDQEYLCPVIAPIDEEEALEEDLIEEEVDLHCNCPPLQCVRNFESEMPDLCGDYGQHPFVVRWVPMVEEERVLPCRPETPPSVCPPCKDSTPCDSECECICEYCECDICDQFEEEECCKISDEHIEDFDTDFTFVAPLRDRPPSEIIEEEEVIEEEEEEDPNAPVKCECVCKYKTGIPDPDDMNYVAPLKDRQGDEPSERGEEAAEELEPPVPKKPVLILQVPTWVPLPDPPEPPPGIRRETMYCWAPSGKSSSISQLSESELPTPPGLKPAACRSADVRKRMIEELRAKQPPPRPICPGPATLAMALSANPRNMKATITKMPPKPEPQDPEQAPNISVVITHGSSKSAAPPSRYHELPPEKRTAGSQTATPSNQPTRPSKPPSTTTKPPETPAKPAAAPSAPVKPPAKNAEPSLTKKDILDILGI